MLNGMLYVRGSSKDYDEWESLGNQGWGWEDVYPYFKKAEKLHNSENPKSDGIDKEFHGQEGKVHVMPLKESSPAAEMYVQGVEELGYKVQVKICRATCQTSHQPLSIRFKMLINSFIRLARKPRRQSFFFR